MPLSLLLSVSLKYPQKKAIAYLGRGSQVRVTSTLVQRALQGHVDLLEQAAGDWTRWASAKAPTP